MVTVTGRGATPKVNGFLICVFQISPDKNHIRGPEEFNFTPRECVYPFYKTVTSLAKEAFWRCWEPSLTDDNFSAYPGIRPPPKKI